MNILVLGGTGAIGNDLVKMLFNCGNKVDITTRKERVSNELDINYIVGDAHNIEFLKSILINNYQVIVDFMSYNTDEFRNRISLLCKYTTQYIFFSSARVYADSKQLITEESPRLLEQIDDEDYLSTDEYALAKARQEDLLKNSEYRNWTIIRPYITYNTERLQLGFFEKERWMYRCLHGKTIVFFKDLLDKTTTLTYGYDLASTLVKLIDNSNALGEIFNITCSDSKTWGEVLNIYLNTIEDEFGKRPDVKLIDSSEKSASLVSRNYQVKYDRIYNRRFDNKKVKNVIENEIEYVSICEGLSNCIKEFINKNQNFNNIDWIWEGYVDRITGEKTKLTDILRGKERIKYILGRYFPYMVRILRKV